MLVNALLLRITRRFYTVHDRSRITISPVLIALPRRDGQAELTLVDDCIAIWFLPAPNQDQRATLEMGVGTELDH